MKDPDNVDTASERSASNYGAGANARQGKMEEEIEKEEKIERYFGHCFVSQLSSVIWSPIRGSASGERPMRMKLFILTLVIKFIFRMRFPKHVP